MLKDKQKREIGEHFESEAIRYLQQQGLSLLDKNFHSRFGEIDLVCLDQHDLVFVEVKYRSSGSFEAAIETVTAAKQRKLVLAAKHFLQQHKRHQHRSCRFDVIAVQQAADKTFGLNWVKNAFYAQD